MVGIDSRVLYVRALPGRFVAGTNAMAGTVEQLLCSAKGCGVQSQAGVIDKKDFRLKFSEINLHDVIYQAVDNMALQVSKRGGSIVTNLDATESIIEGDATHISNMIYNLLDNANKYTPDEPHIEVATREIPNGVEVTVKDNGIGLTKEQLDKLWNALEYTLGTISNGCLFESESNPEYVEIHRGRAVQSRRFLTNAKSTVNKLLNDLKEVNEPHAGEQQ